MRTVMILPCCFALTLIITGCGGGDDRSTAAQAPAAAPADPAAPAAAPSTEPYSEGGSMKPFYGEVFHDGRYYVFGTKVEFTRYLTAFDVNPLISKNFIAKGPNRATVVAQAPKESPSMPSRLVNQLRTRHGLPPLE